MKTVVVDIDGTIADITHRLPYVKNKKKDWKTFFDLCDKDSPIPDIIQLVKDLYLSGYRIVFFTGRREVIREKTIEWLQKNLPFLDKYDVDFRGKSDYRNDSVIKEEMLYDYFDNPKEDIFLVLDDRDRVVEMWRKNGIRCLQVKNGNY